MGVIRHFPVGDLSKIVVIDPQFLFDNITELIVNTFTFKDAGKLLSKEFKDKGIFFYDDFEQISTIQNTLLTHSRFIDLLKHLRIIVPYNDRGRNKLFIPCVLAHADKALNPPRQHSAIPKLAIVFNCGYCSKGVTGAVIKYLMTNEMMSQYTWKLQSKKIFRNQVEFLVGAILITLCLHPTHFEIVCAPNSETAKATCNIQDTCREVCASIQMAIHTVSKDMNLTCRCEAAFYCTQCSKSHIAELVKERGVPCQLWCDKKREFCDLPSGYGYWFQPPAQSEQAKQLDGTDLTLSSALKLVFPLASKWKNLGAFLNVKKETLDKIEHDYQKADDCLREVLSVWLNTISPPPSWQMLADAIEPLDSATAKRIHNGHCDTALYKPSRSCSCMIM